MISGRRHHFKCIVLVFVFGAPQAKCHLVPLYFKEGKHLISKTHPLTTKQTSWIYSATGNRKICHFDVGVNCPFNFSFLLLTCVIDFLRLAFCGHRGLSFGSLTNTGPIHSTIDNTGGNGTDCVLAAAGHKLPSQLKSSSPHKATYSPK